DVGSAGCPHPPGGTAGVEDTGSRGRAGGMLSPWLQPRSTAHPEPPVPGGTDEPAGPTGRWTARMQPHLPLGRARSARGAGAPRPTPFRRPTPFPRASTEELSPATDLPVAVPAEAEVDPG